MQELHFPGTLLKLLIKGSFVVHTCPRFSKMCPVKVALQADIDYFGRCYFNFSLLCPTNDHNVVCLEALVQFISLQIKEVCN